MVGRYLPHDATAQDERNPAWWRTRQSGQWLALCRRRGVVELVSTTMTASPMEVDGDKNGLLVAAPGCPDALVPIRGLPRKGGEVPTARVEKKAAPSPRQHDTTWSLFLGERTSRLFFQDAVGLPLMMSTNQHTEELRNWKDAAAGLAPPGSKRNDWGFAGGVEVLWAGDLNDDAELDLLLKQGDAEIGTSTELFLSSGGKAAPRLLLADRFAAGAC